MTEPTSNKSGSKLNSGSIEPGQQISVKELSQFLSDFGKSLRRPTKGSALGEALIRFSNTLRRHQDKELDEVLELLGAGETLRKKQRRQNPEHLEGIDLRALGTNEVKDLLSNVDLSKQDLIEVGAMRLGISKSRLERQNKESVLESVASALQNEEAYQIISREAEKEGLRRAKVQRMV